MNRWLSLLLLLAVGLAPATHASAETATGVVFHDRDDDGARDDGEPGIEGVRVSNGREVTRTDADGRYRLPVDGDTILFVCKPRGWTYPTDELNLPRFYYIHKPDGSPDAKFKYPGSEPTGPLPDSVDFPLHRQDGGASFRVVLMGDPQPSNMREVRYYGRDIMSELVGVDAAFGLSLGDIVGNDLSLFGPVNEMQALAGVPWHNVVGNHDINFRSPADAHANETFERVYGPTDYAFQYGKVHFLPLDNVVYHGHPERGYHGGLTDRRLTFLENYLATVPASHRIVLATHIPLYNRYNKKRHTTRQRERVLEMLSKFANTASFSAHTHLNAVYHLDADDGYAPAHGHGVHTHHNLGTASGSWWKGPLDARGIPITTMRDGTPNGYAIATFDGADGMTVRWKAANHPRSYQMRIAAPDALPADALGGEEAKVVVNVFNGSERSAVHLRVPGETDWLPMRRTFRKDPFYVEQHKIDQATPMKNTERMKAPRKSTHIWVATLPEGLPTGTHLVEVRAEDAYGHTYRGRRPFRVK